MRRNTATDPKGDKHPMSNFDPTEHLTSDEAALYSEAQAQAAARHATQQATAALREATELVAAAQNAVANGEATNQEIAAYLFSNGATVAHDMFVSEWQKEEAEEARVIAVDDLAEADADTYLAHIEELREQEVARLQNEIIETSDQLGRAQLAQLGGQLRTWVETNPGAHEYAEAVEARLKQLVLDQQSVPTDEAGQQRMVAQAIRDVSIREGLAAQFTEQVETEWRAQEHARKARAFSTRQSDDRSQQQRAADEAAWKGQRLEELSTQYTREDVESMRELPLSGVEIAEIERQKYVDRQAKSDSFHQRVAGIADRGKQAASGDGGHSNFTHERRAYREAVERAEREAMYGKFAPDVKTGYGPTAEQAKPKDIDTPIDEFGGAFPGYRRA
jgi:hypothetical protein